MTDPERPTGSTKSVDVRYQLLEQVGQGGMAIVYKGTDKTLNREVAVKVLHPHLAENAESRARLQREAHAVAKLRHENILEIFDYSGPDSPDSYIVTEFIHGCTLKSFLDKHKTLPFPELAEMIVSEVAGALEHAHSLGVIHRDVKPENVMIRNDGRVKLTDFGIAQIVDKERMTVTGQLLGSPAYMAPEHVEGKPIGFRTDVFAVGILAYQLATGELPFRGKNPHEVLKRIAECKYAPPESVNPKIGKRLSRIIAKALARDPDARFDSVGAMRRELLEDLADAGVTDPRKPLADFFAAPDAFAKKFHRELVTALTAKGRELRGRGRTAAALELWGRALQLDPGSSDLKQLVEGVARRQTLIKAAVRAGIATVLLGVVGFLAWTTDWNRKLPKTPAAAPAASAAPAAPPQPKVDPAPAAAPPPVAAPLEAKVDHRPIARHTAAKPAPAREPARTQSVELVPTPKAVRISLDGAALGDYGPALSHIEVAADRPHTIRFESPFCFPEDFPIKAGEVPAKIMVRLKWKPARLTIESEPPGADLLLDGSLPGHAGSPIPLKIPDLSPDGRRTVKIKASAPGMRSTELSVEVRANETKTQTVKLTPVAE